MKIAFNKLLIAAASLLSLSLCSCGPEYDPNNFCWTDRVKLNRKDITYAFEHIPPEIVKTRYQFFEAFAGSYGCYYLDGFETLEECLPILDCKKTMKWKSFDDVCGYFEGKVEATVSFMAETKVESRVEVFYLHFFFDFDSSLVFSFCVYDINQPTLFTSFKHHVYILDEEQNNRWETYLKNKSETLSAEESDQPIV